METSYKEYLEKQGFSGRSIGSFSGVLLRWENWLSSRQLRPVEAGYGHVLDYLEECRKKGCTAHTRSGYLNGLKHYYRYLKAGSLIEESPIESMELKGVKRHRMEELLSGAELESLYKDCHSESMTGKRNRVVVGLLVYQGLSGGDLGRLEPRHVKLREGVLEVPGSRRTEGRALSLEASQVLDLQEYMERVRPALLSGRVRNELLVSSKSGTKFGNVLNAVLGHIRRQNGKIKDLNHIRSSVITGWLKTKNLREVQYRAGHRYVSSTERYKENDLEELSAAVALLHPLK